MSGNDKELFLESVRLSVADETFVRLTLGKVRGTDDIKKLVVTPVVIKGKPRLKFVTSRARQDVTQNHDVTQALTELAAALGETFLSATLFTTDADLSLQFSKKGQARLTRAKATYSSPPDAAHDRTKQYLVDPAAGYLAALGVSDAKGAVKPSMFGKFKQIAHFIEIIDGLVRESELKESASLRVADIGSGKGYLTFALYDYLSRRLNKEAHVMGIEVRSDLVALCNDVAKSSGFSGLVFDAREAAASGLNGPLDILIALHACDTATDDAIAQGLAAGAAMIVTAPCCQHELAPQIALKGDLEGLVKFGLFKQRYADLVTDAARCLLLEAHGYNVKVIEFVSTEHTAKNILIAAVRSASVNRDSARQQYAALKAAAGFTNQHLERQLSGT